MAYFCFHDVDVMATAHTIREHVDHFARIVDRLDERMHATGVRLLWGTANLFSHPRYMSGAATNPDPDAFRFAATQVRHCLEATHRLGGANHVLWGGREGYDTLLNTDPARETQQLGRFLSMVVDHKHRIGFSGAILLEPKSHEPTTHQHDFDVETVYGFLRRPGLEGEVKLNVEANHATLAGHSFEHEIASAIELRIFGSIDMNRGDPQNGWDTDQFPVDLRELTLVMHYVLRAGGFATGGINFDAKVRRQSIDPADLFLAHVGGIDVVAKALLNAAALIENGTLERAVATRYAGWEAPDARDMLAKGASLAGISDEAVRRGIDPRPRSGSQEALENVLTRYSGS